MISISSKSIDEHFVLDGVKQEDYGKKEKDQA